MPTNIVCHSSLETTLVSLGAIAFWCSNRFCLNGLNLCPTAMDCVGLAVEWEASADLRERIRAEKRVLKYAETEKYCKANRVNAVNNSLVLIPVLKRLGKTESFRLPHLDDMKVEVTTLFAKCGLDTGSKKPYQTSVEIKQLAGFVKRRSTRKEVTKAWGTNEKHWKKPDKFYTFGNNGLQT